MHRALSADAKRRTRHLEHGHGVESLGPRAPLVNLAHAHDRRDGIGRRQSLERPRGTLVKDAAALPARLDCPK
eukprot:4839596-Prymnesium_polylepis.1